MSFNASMLRQMRDEGLDLDACIRIFEAGEAEKSPAAVRQQRYRDGKRNECDVTRYVTPPLKDNSKPRSVSDETGGEPPDPVKELFDLGVSMLKSQGHSEPKARSIIGSWRKGRSPGEVVAALVDAKTSSVSNLVEWMPKRLTPNRPTDPADFVAHYAAEKKRMAAGASR